MKKNIDCPVPLQQKHKRPSVLTAYFVAWIWKESEFAEYFTQSEDVWQCLRDTCVTHGNDIDVADVLLQIVHRQDISMCYRVRALLALMFPNDDGMLSEDEANFKIKLYDKGWGIEQIDEVLLGVYQQFLAQFALLCTNVFVNSDTQQQQVLRMCQNSIVAMIPSDTVVLSEGLLCLIDAFPVFVSDGKFSLDDVALEDVHEALLRDICKKCTYAVFAEVIKTNGDARPLARQLVILFIVPLFYKEDSPFIDRLKMLLPETVAFIHALPEEVKKSIFGGEMDAEMDVEADALIHWHAAEMLWNKLLEEEVSRLGILAEDLFLHTDPDDIASVSFLTLLQKLYKNTSSWHQDRFDRQLVESQRLESEHRIHLQENDKRVKARLAQCEIAQNEVDAVIAQMK